VKAGPHPGDAFVAELLERVGRAHDLMEAAFIFLESVATTVGVERAALLVRGSRGTLAVTHGLERAEAAGLSGRSAAAEEILEEIAGQRAPAPLRAAPLGRLGIESAVPLPLRDRDGEISAGLVLDAPPDDAAIPLAGAILDRCGFALLQAARLDQLADRVGRLDRQRDLLTSIINTIADPVLLTDANNGILLTNSRAERLFSSAPEDSEGRRRAIQVNTLLFSSFLTQSAIGAQSGGRELNLVDPTEGSDLLFEVLSVSLEGGAGTGEGAVISVLRDITDLKRAVAQLESEFRRSRSAEHRARREKDQLNVVLENVGDPILVTDDQSNIILMNRAAERLFVAAGEGSARRKPRIVQANDTRFTTLISDFLLQPQRRRVEKITLSDPDSGAEFPVEVVSSKILNDRAEPTAIVSVLHDLAQVVENERLARELQHLNDDLEDRIRRATVELEDHNRRLEWQSHELEKAYQLKSEFLASMSHELRTPINVILGYTSLMRERIYGELTAQQEEALLKVYGTSQHLLELISDILDLSKIEAGKMPVHIEEVRLQELLTELAQTVEPMVQRKGLVYEAELGPDLPVLQTDRTKLRQILLNLVTNAIKFTSQGAVRIIASAPEDGRLRLAVRDSGIGIKPEHVDVIFDDFRQVDQSPTREYGGTGLGLSITKKLLTLLGGTIRVESAFGRGTTFTIDLPVHAPVLPVPEQVQRTVMTSDETVVGR
jgi:PAS domain S-box-containing protein